MLKPGQTRFILAFAVIFFHLSQSIFLGKFAVGCFFILSGYWIALMYEKKYSKKEHHLKVFYISRIWRLLPAFYTFTILGVIVNLMFRTGLFSSFGNLDVYEKIYFAISNITILGYAHDKIYILVPAWSIDVEMQFYLLFPLLAYLYKGNKKNIIYLLIVSFLIAALIFVAGLKALSETSFYYLYLFIIGILMYHLKYKPNNKLEKGSLILLFAIVLIQYIIPGLSVYYRDSNSDYYTLLSFVLTVVAIPALISSVYKETNANDRFWGEMSFMVYLCHWVWIGPYNIFIQHGSKFSRIPYAVGFLAITFLTSYIVYKFVDRPSEMLRHKWVNLQK